MIYTTTSRPLKKTSYVYIACISTHTQHLQHNAVNNPYTLRNRACNY